MPEDMPKTEEEWKRKLTPEQYRVLREKGTEPAFCGIHWNSKKDGVYRCAGCNEPLFASDEKFDSGTGWPSFFAPVSEGKVKFVDDISHGMVRMEIQCAKCGGHLGHVFDDGPPPTHKRFCINSVSLKFEDKK